jgi:hypothetical protein
MIALDTNQVLGKTPDGALLRMLRKAAEEAGHDLVLPEMVVEEYLAHYLQDVQVAVKKARDAIDHLHRLIPSWRGQAPPFGSAHEMAEKKRRDHLEQIFRIHPTPSGTWQEALIREARRHPPAKTSWENPGSGARDVAVWLTVVDACQADGGETYFVTANSSDFGKEGSLRPELAKDLDDRLGQKAHLLRYCPDIPTLMGELGIAKARPPEDDSIGSATAVRMAIQAALTDGDVFFEFMQGIPYSALNFIGAFEGIEHLRLERLQDKVEAYRIGEGVWACTWAMWAGWKEFSVAWKPAFVPSALGRSVRVNFTVNATVVMQLDQDGTITAAEITDRSRLVIREE